MLEDGLGRDDYNIEEEGGDKREDGCESEGGNYNCMEERLEHGYYSFVLR